jgi:PAS domain S-box-containing protein
MNPSQSDEYGALHARILQLEEENQTLRKTVEARSAIADPKVRSVLDSLFSFAGLMTPEGVLIEANRYALNSAALTTSDVIGQQFEETYWWSWSADVQHQLRNSIQRAAAGETCRYDVVVRLAEGRFATIDFAVVPVFDQAGRVIYLVPSATDITDRVAAEQEVRRREESYRTLIEALPQLVWTATADGVCDYLSPQWIAFTGVAADQRLGDAWVNAVHPDDRQAAIERWRAAVTSGTRFDAEFRIGRADGRFGWFKSRGVPIRDRSGKVVRWFGTCTDIDDEKAVEKALRESEARFRHLADSMPQIVWTATPDGYLDYYNRRWYEFTGMPRSAGGDESWKPVLHPDDVQRCLERWYTSVGTGEIYQIEYRFRNASTGAYRWHLGRALPVRDESGAIVRWFGTSTDIEEQKRTEDELRRANEQLSQFAFAASHDLQEPLRMVLAYSDLLRRRLAANIDEAEREFLDYISEGGHRMHRLLSDLRAYTYAANTVDGDPPLTSCRTALQTAVENLEAAIEENEADVWFDELPSVRVHQLHLVQLFQNLIGNAIKYRGEAPPRIRVRAEPSGASFLFSVADNGIGIDPQYSKLIFGVFKRLHGQRYSGTGIGLAICQKIVENYGGRIWVESELGKGATFRFTLPS